LWQINSPPFPLPPGGSPLTAQFGNACTTACLPECSPPNNLRNTTNTCYTTWAAVLDAIEANSGGIFPNLDGFRRDVWGSPYLIDENEGVADSLCHPDYIKSVGPDGAASGGDNIDLILPFNSVGKVFPIPFPNNGSPDYLYTGGGLPDYSAGYRCQCTQKGICVQI